MEILSEVVGTLVVSGVGLPVLGVSGLYYVLSPQATVPVENHFCSTLLYLCAISKG